MKTIRTIGFTGTIASGKTSRCRHLVEVAKKHQSALTAAAAAATGTGKASGTASSQTTESVPVATPSVLVHYINADLVGHNIYEPGKPCYKDLVQHFGAAILPRTSSLSAPHPSKAQHSRAGSEKAPPLLPPSIDRGALGDIVFSDERKLQELNEICWPYISAAIRDEHAAVCARATGASPPPGIDEGILTRFPPGPAAEVAVIIVEAALLCDMSDVLSLTTDLWMTHCTPMTAVDRLMERNHLSREAAERRVASQRDVGQKLQALRELMYKGDIEVFDTTQVTLTTGLKETERAFDRFWKNKVMVHLSP